jgi:hypothetical protein
MTAHIKTLLSSFIKTEHAWHHTLLTQWTTLLGSLSERLCLEKIQQNTLVLGVYDTHWMQELYLLSPMIIKTINDQLGYPHVQALRFKAVSPKKNNTPTYIPTLKPRKKKIVPLTSMHRVALEKIEDPELRSMVQEFWFRCCSQR